MLHWLIVGHFRVKELSQTRQFRGKFYVNNILIGKARNTSASALLRKHKAYCKHTMPRVPNLLEQLVRKIPLNALPTRAGSHFVNRYDLIASNP
ncbi:MAG: hypothetical protein ACTMIA_03290, partial [Vibrio sp.]